MSVSFIPRWSTERGNADHDWLKTFHTFSFASYYDINHQSFGSLRVLNEDRVQPHTGFGTHGHREFEIFSYVVSGELKHGDSMKNEEVLKRGDIQLTSAGTGIYHSEKAHGNQQVHFLQIWAKPWKSGLTPKYYTRHFSDDEKRNKWARVVAPITSAGVSPNRELEGTETGPAPVQAPITLFATLLSPNKSLEHVLPTQAQQQQQGKRKAYVHVVQTSGYNTDSATGASVRVSGSGSGSSGPEVVLKEGDGVYVLGDAGATLNFENVGDRVAEVLLFDVE